MMIMDKLNYAINKYGRPDSIPLSRTLRFENYHFEKVSMDNQSKITNINVNVGNYVPSLIV